MVERAQRDESDVDGIVTTADELKNAWTRTLADMRARAESYEERGWDVLTVAADHSAAEHPHADPQGRYGFVHVVPEDVADDLRGTIEGRSFPEYDVFRATTGGRVFLVTELLDPDSSTAVLVAGSYELQKVGLLVAAADEEGVCYTHLRTLDGTLVGSFEHEAYEKFVPSIERFRD